MIGADEVFLPDVQAAEEAARRLVQPSLKAYFELIDGYSVAEIQAPEEFHGKTLADLDLKRRFRINLVAITKPAPSGDGKPRVNAVPQGGDVIERGDLLAVAGADKDLKFLLSLRRA
jgi:trk system potassium uptake protein TrkA